MKQDPIRPYGEQIKSGDKDSILASIYRAILFNANVQKPRFEMLLTSYVQKAYRKASNLKDRTSIKAGLYKELMKDRMSFKVFVKGLRVLNVVRMEISIKLHDQNNYVLEVYRNIDLNEAIDTSDTEEEMDESTTN